jgi:hypothetical protein
MVRSILTRVLIGTNLASRVLSAKEQRMEVHDFDGACRVERDDELLARLRSVRRGADGSFILDHGAGGTRRSTIVLIN